MSARLKLKNEGSEELMIVSIASDLQVVEVKYNDRLPIYIHPGKEVEFTIKYIPLIYGRNTAYTLIKLNNGKGYFYKVTASGIENQFDLRPIVIKTNRLGHLESFPLYIRNPYNKQIVITSVQAQDRRIDIQYLDEELMCCSGSVSVAVQPSQRLLAFNVVFALHSPDTVFSIIRIRLQHEAITLPILIKGMDEMVLMPEVVDFGMVNEQHGAHRIMLRAESFHEPAAITEVFYKKSPHFVLHLFNATQRPIIIPRGDRPTVLGYVGFYAGSSGFYDSKVYFVINASRVLKLELRARVTDSLFLQFPSKVLIDLSNKHPKDVQFRSTGLQDELNQFGSIISLQTDDDLVKAQFVCQRIDSTGHCSLRDSILQLSYTGLNYTAFPLKRYVTLFLVSSLVHIQLTFYDSNLQCIYTEFAENETPSLIKKRCSEIDKINLGFFGGSPKFIDLHLMNTNPVEVNITDLALKNDNAHCCMELLVLNNENTESLFKKWEHGKVTTLANSSVLAVQPGAMAILRIYASLKDCGKARNMKTIDGDSFSNWLLFNSGAIPINIKLEYVHRSGDFSFSPSRMRFEPGFPGTTQSKELWAISTFKVPLKILRSWTTDKRIEFHQNIEQITSDSKSELGVVRFSPGNVPEEQHFASLKSRILSWYDSTISLGELKLWREIQLMWDAISATGGTLIDSELLVDTNILQGVKLAVKAELTRPILVKDNELNFQLVQNASRKELTFQIYNPAPSPLMVQLFTADPSSANYKANMPLSFYPRVKSCSENYTAWTKKYDTTMQQIRSKRRLTSYSSFDDFAEDYCCYMGKYNSSILYSQKFDELADNDLSATLAKHCYSKSITKFGQASVDKSVKKKTKGIWNLVFKEVKHAGNLEHKAKEEFTFPAKFSQSPVVIPPLSYLTVGPIVYSPTTVGAHTGVIFIKNNLTVLYPIRLRGESGVGVIEFIEETNELLRYNKLIHAVSKEHLASSSVQNAEVEFRIAQSDLLVERRNESSAWPSFIRRYSVSSNIPYRVRKSHGRVFTVRNIGNIPLVVERISVENRGCSAYGITVVNCEGFTLEPQQSYKLLINYTTGLVISSFKYALVFRTNSGLQTFDLAIKLPFNALTLLQQIPLIDEYVLELNYSKYVVAWEGFARILILFIGLVVGLYSIKDLLFGSKSLSPVRVSVVDKSKFSKPLTILSMSRALTAIERNRIAFTQEALKKKSSESPAYDRKKLTKRNKLKRADPIEHDNTQLEARNEAHQNEEKKATQLSAKKNKEAVVLEEIKKTVKKLPQAKNPDSELKVQCTSPAHKQDQKHAKKPKDDHKLLKDKPEEILSSIIKASQTPIKSPEPQPNISQAKDAAPNEDARKVDKSAQTKSSEEPSKTTDTAKSNADEIKSEPEPKKTAAKAEESAKTEAVQEEPKFPHHQQYRGFDYRDQYSHYQSSVTGSHFKRGPPKHGYRHQQTIYKKKTAKPSAGDKEYAERKAFVNKSFSESLKESDDEKVLKAGDFLSEKKATPLIQANPVPTEVSEEAPLVKKSCKHRTYSITSEEGIKRRGLGGILLGAESPQEDGDEREAGKEPVSPVDETAGEWSEQDFYSCFNPLSKFDLKLPNPFTVKEETEEEEKHHSNEEISLFEAYNSASSLLGGRTLVSESESKREAEKFVSPLSELRGDSVEYIPSLQRRFVGGNGKDEDCEFSH